MKRKFEVYSRLNASLAWSLVDSFESHCSALKLIERRIYFNNLADTNLDYMVKVVEND